MSEVRCFLVVDTDRDRLELRRYAPNTSCPGPSSYHNESVPIGESASQGAVESGKGPYEGDPRWPARCSCGYEFQPADQWQVFRSSIYRREETGEEWISRELPPGAMYDAPWWHDHHAGPDGKSLMLCLPPNGGHRDIWHIDGEASNGPGWQRTGEPPNMTATPSIQTPRYHGWLRNGVLVEC